jgi:choline-sulfatase
MTIRRRTLALIIVAAALVGGLWWRAADPRQAPMGVVLITLDTTRADRLPAYGFMDASMPHLDRLAREGVVFDQAASVSPLTLPAHASLFTGLLPPAHGVRDNADSPLAPDHTTLAEILQGRGFRTGAFVGSVVVDADRGLAQGFERYSGVGASDRPRPRRGQRRADEVIGDATGWLEEVAGSRFFLWAHLYDPHRPYDPPEPFRSRYADPYVGEIAFADSQIGRLLEQLEAHDLLDRTLLIVAADHGESLGEHGERDHGIFIYQSVIRVPLIMRGPGIAPGRIGEVVRLTDVMPTVLDLLGIPAPALDGVSLVDLMRGRRGDLDREAYAESLYPQRFGWSPLRALRQGRYKFIEAPRPELYDLHRDPFEERNLYDERRPMADALAQRLAVIGDREPAPGGRAEAGLVSPALQQRLAALGYVGSVSPRALPEAADLPDPKDCIGFFQAGFDSPGVLSVEARKDVSERCRGDGHAPRQR